MKQFYYIDENNQEQIDLIHLFEHAFDYNLTTYEIIIALKILQKHIQILKK